MPKQKDLKRLVRARMQKTGESYTAARNQVIRKNSTARPPASAGTLTGPGISRADASGPESASSTSRMSAETPSGLAAMAGMSDDAVQAKTGRSWAEWTRLLDRIDAVNLPHRDIVAHVDRVAQIGSWWSQTVTVGYERIRGLRERGQRRDGTYECSKSRTFRVPVETLYRAFANASFRNRWLGDVALQVRKATPSKSVRMTWSDGTNVEVGLVAKGQEKSQVAIGHTRLRSKEASTRLKTWWGERLERLDEVLRD